MPQPTRIPIKDQMRRVSFDDLDEPYASDADLEEFSTAEETACFRDCYYCDWQTSCESSGFNVLKLKQVHRSEFTAVARLAERYKIQSPRTTGAGQRLVYPLACWSRHLEIHVEDISAKSVIESSEAPATAYPTTMSDTERAFQAFAKQWHDEIGPDSSLSNITGNINYLRIISLGKPVIPFILKELQREPAPWFLALRVITGELTLGKEHAGDFRKMAAAWIEWGIQNGYLDT